MPVQPGSVPVRSAGDGPRTTRNPLTGGTTMAGRPFPGAAAPFKKGGGRAAEGSPTEEAAESPAKETAEKKAGIDSITTVKHLRDAIAAEPKVPAPHKPAVRAKLIGHARRLDAMQHVPPAWMKK